ncbi:hypothetical protein BJ508DRAFT_134324 [Ascobolus immersus RN42]|uniref:Uncharacterized protein n=1 Tax=Ascobolus immersus RN42 TaxID=1160509 RepID=A0A3N4IK08_ASCIM|nr:hypothetical protein BJ508DRAFT_134324 [Ascobolus immersus RN42]
MLGRKAMARRGLSVPHSGRPFGHAAFLRIIQKLPVEQIFVPKVSSNMLRSTIFPLRQTATHLRPSSMSHPPFSQSSQQAISNIPINSPPTYPLSSQPTATIPLHPSPSLHRARRTNRPHLHSSRIRYPSQSQTILGVFTLAPVYRLLRYGMDVSQREEEGRWIGGVEGDGRRIYCETRGFCRSWKRGTTGAAEEPGGESTGRCGVILRWKEEIGVATRSDYGCSDS